MRWGIWVVRPQNGGILRMGRADCGARPRKWGYLRTRFRRAGGPPLSRGDIRITTCIVNVRIDKIQSKWELVGTHTGRRTFIVNALSLGITPNIVMKWTGHSDYKAMKPYIDIVDSIKASSMTKFDGLL